MTKETLIDELAARCQTSKATAQAVMEATFNVIAEELERGGHVAIPRFGRFTVAHRNARSMRNPQTGDPMEVPAKWVAKFKPASALADSVAAQRVRA